MVKNEWRLAQVEKEKLWVGQQIKSDCHQLGPTEKLKYLLNAVNRLANDLTMTNSMRRYFYIMHTLIHHETFGGLSITDLKSLTQLGLGTLAVHGIKPIESKLSFLHGELHYVLSQIAVKKGHFIEALWWNQLAQHLSGPNQPGGNTSFLNLSSGLCALRLGHCRLATHYFDKCKIEELTPDSQQKLHLGRLRILRLNQKFDEARSYLVGIEDINSDKGGAFERELIWEKMCWKISESEDLSELVNCVKKGGSHYQESYILEVFMWAHCTKSMQWRTRVAKVSTLKRRKDLSFKNHKLMFLIATAIEEAYDSEIPFAIRLNQILEVIEEISYIRNIDKQALVYLAIGRWLSRSKSLKLALVMFMEYRSLSLRVSDQKLTDCLGVATDIGKKIEEIE